MPFAKPSPKYPPIANAALDGDAIFKSFFSLESADCAAFFAAEAIAEILLLMPFAKPVERFAPAP